MASVGSQKDRPIRVLIIVENLPVPFDRRVWQEAQALRDAGYEVSVICPTGKGHESRREDLEGIHIYRHPLPLDARGPTGYVAEYGAALFWQTTLAWQIYRERGFDVIHACNPPDNIFMVAAPFKALGVKFIFDHHDICPELYEAKFGRRDALYWLVRAWERATFALADVSIATNESYKRIAIERGGMDPSKVFVVRSGPDLSRVRQVPPNPSLKRGRKYLVGYVGVMGKQEGIEYLLRAIECIVHTKGRTDIHFGLVGGGPELRHLQELAVKLSLTDYVTFTGRVPDADLLEMLCTADICVNPDEHNEMNDKSTMNKVLEYMALGKPIVQFDLTEGRFSAAGASIYVKPNDVRALTEGILATLDDAELRDRMSQIGEARVSERMSWAHSIPHLLDAYRAAIPTSA